VYTFIKTTTAAAHSGQAREKKGNSKNDEEI
jgi:hypothetical protein